MKKIWKQLLSIVLVLAFLGFSNSFSAAALETSQTDDHLLDYANEVLLLVNDIRTDEGLNPLSLNSELSAAATERAVECLYNFNHTRPDGSSCFTVLDEHSIKYWSAGENIARGQRTPEEVVSDWMASEGHRENILDPEFQYIGVGVAEEDGIYAWEEMFVGGVTLKESYVPTEEILLGDGDFDGEVTPNDAHLSLSGYAKYSLAHAYGLTSQQQEVLDVDSDTYITPQDAYLILTYYAESALSSHVEWSDILGDT